MNTHRPLHLCVLALFLMIAVTAVYADTNEPMVKKFPSAHVAVHYYCPDCPQAEKDFVAETASLINHGCPTDFEHLLPSHPEVSELVNIRYRFVQYVQYMNLYGGLNQTGQVDMALLEQYASQNGHNVEDFFLHFSEPTRMEYMGCAIDYDGSRTILTDRNGVDHVVNGNRAMAIVWSDFYFLFDWNSEAWYGYIRWRAQQELNETLAGTAVFDGYFEDVLNGPITDTFRGIVHGGGIVEFGGLDPVAISAQGLDHDLIATLQSRLDQDLPGKVFLPNSGNYMEDWAVDTMLAGDGTLTEMVNEPGSKFVRRAWETAIELGENHKYYMMATVWDTTPSGYDSGYYDSARERGDLHNIAVYWMGYVPGYTSISTERTCCDWSEVWPNVIEADLGDPAGDPVLVDTGVVNGWHWRLYKREFEKGTVYMRPNNIWMDGNGGGVTFGTSTAVNFDLPADAQILRSTGEWVDAPDSIDHMESFGFVIRTGTFYGDDDDDDDDIYGDDDDDDDDIHGDDDDDDDNEGGSGCGLTDWLRGTGTVY